MSQPVRTALVTGSTSGIGLGIAEGFARAGLNVVYNGFGPPDAIAAIETKLKALGAPQVRYAPTDMSKPADIRAMVAEIDHSFGGLDVIVNNAGVQHVSPIEDFPVEKWDLILAINLSSAFHTIAAAMAGMKARRFGRIINIASAHGHVASPFKSAYVAAKHGIIGLTKTVALEGATFNVRCNAVSPGYVLTPLVENQIPDTMKARNMTREQVIHDVLLAAQPTKEFVTIEQIAGLCSFLISPSADQINGAAINVDGGWVAQ